MSFKDMQLLRWVADIVQDGGLIGAARDEEVVRRRAEGDGENLCVVGLDFESGLGGGAGVPEHE